MCTLISIKWQEQCGGTKCHMLVPWCDSGSGRDVTCRGAGNADTAQHCYLSRRAAIMSWSQTPSLRQHREAAPQRELLKMNFARYSVVWQHFVCTKTLKMDCTQYSESFCSYLNTMETYVSVILTQEYDFYLHWKGEVVICNLLFSRTVCSVFTQSNWTTSENRSKT